MQHYFLKLSRIRKVQILRVSNYSNSVMHDLFKLGTTDTDDLLDPKVRQIKDKLKYCDYIEKKKLKFGYNTNKEKQRKLEYKLMKGKQLVERQTPAISVALKYLDGDKTILHQQSELNSDDEYSESEVDAREQKPIHMPYSIIDTYKKVPTKNFQHKEQPTIEVELDDKFKKLYEKYLELSNYASANPGDLNAKNASDAIKVRLEDDLSKIPSSWMTDYEIYDDSLEDFQDVKYGTPDPNADVSSVPCGGCGALLHCKDVAIPGYLPSELFLNKTIADLRSVTCQRCHFMKNYHTCLDVRVSPDEYPKLLEKINDNRRAIVILLVDLTDFPCSIWPKLPEVIGTKRHVYVVGNKIDLLPKDSTLFLDHVKDSLTESLIEIGLTKTNIKHVGLISAKTGYGIEQLINKLYKVWQYRSDVYIVGCTNAGKSTLFNTLLQSDFCKSQAVDLIQRATTSPWPGTTLNLLKFPILRHNSSRLKRRTLRLKQDQTMQHQEQMLREKKSRLSRNIELATLQSRIVHTFKDCREINLALDRSKENTDIITIDTKKNIGLDETAPEFKTSHWCYDTPGTIQPDQILHFLTTDELMKTLPSRIISPRTFCIQPGLTIFIAGLGRLDILESSNFIRCTVFASNKLPITICEVEDSELVYNELLHTEAFVVPMNNPERLKMWPELKSKDFETIGVGHKESVSDVVLSSAGWIAITADENQRVVMRGWTPEGRGIYLRTPALLPNSVNHRGMRKLNSLAYRLGRQIYYSKKQSRI
ncbi:nitric oxide-associated protein 1 [Nasonia vitripennis]|uniref:G domain-containing protein n=1 Tax=Nasonia vitripennis TaxID=7425 RepID=A0A7M7LL37_NASVI|nr:nitric oxide-associated protein 1 [Nasonia vitripennis]